MLTLWVYLALFIERLHIHSNENKHKNNHGYGVKSVILLYQFQCACCDKYMDKKCKNAYLIEARHFKHGKWLLYEEMNNIYDACLYLLRNQQSAIQRLVGLVQQYGVNTA